MEGVCKMRKAFQSQLNGERKYNIIGVDDENGISHFKLLFPKFHQKLINISKFAENMN